MCMKKQNNIIKAGTIFMMLLLMMLIPISVHAAESRPSTNPLADMSTKHVKVVVSAPTGMGCDYFTPCYNTDFQMTATSSNKKVATVKVYDFKREQGYSKGYEVIRKGYGTTTIKVTVKIKNKTYTKACKYTYYKYKNPFVSFKIGKNDHTSMLNKKYQFNVAPEKLTGKLSYKLKTGYKVVYMMGDKKQTDFSKPPERIKLKNSTKIPSNVETIWIRVENTKTKLRTTIRLERNDGIMLTGL